MSVYTPPALNAVDFPLTAFTPADNTPPYNELAVHTPPALNAVDFALTVYTPPTYPDVGWELLPGVGPTNYTLNAAAGAYTLSGQAATFTVARVLPAAAGAYVLAGQSATLRASRVLPASAGSYTLAGQDATLRAARTLPAAAGAYTLAGQDATLTYTPGPGAYELPTDAGSYTFAGQDATLTYGPVTPPTPSPSGVGDFYWPLKRPLQHRTLAAAPGAYAFRGGDAALHHDHTATDEAIIAALLLD